MNANDNYTGSDGTGYTVHGTGPEDTSPVYTGEYVYACGGCYLGHAHSEDKHAAAVKG